MITAALILLLVLGVPLAWWRGFVTGSRQTPRMIARMTEAELDQLAERVERERNGTR